MVGEILRKERENQRLTIQDVEEGTSIRSSYIEAIESGEYDKMPGRVYAKGFIKNYANFLKLDGDEFVKRFVEEVSPAIEVVEQINEKVKETSSNESKSTTFSISGRRLEIEITKKFSSNHLVAAIVLLALFVGGFFFFKGTGTEIASVDTKQLPEIQQTAPTATTPAPVAEPTPAPAVTESAPVAPEVAPAPTPAATPSPAVAPTSPTADGVNVKASFSGDCWMLVSVDGAIVYEGMMNAGQVMDWKGNQNVDVRVGNAGAVEFVMNGQNFGKLGAEGDVVDRNFTR